MIDRSQSPQLIQSHNKNRSFSHAISGKLTIVYLCGGLIAARIAASLILPAYDDAFISLRYGRNLAQGVGFVYNLNEHVLGETCPLFGMIESLMFVLHLPMPGAVLALNILCDVAILWITTRILQRSGFGSGVVIFALGFAFNPIMARICIGCMQMDLFLLCSLVAIILYHRQNEYSAIALASVAFFLRPEAVLLVGLFCILELSKKSYVRVFRMALLSLLIVAGPLYWIWSYYGSIIAQSVSAKSRAVQTPYLSIFRELIFNDPLQIILFLFGIWGITCSWKRSDVLRTIAIWMGLYALVYLGYRAFVYSWYGETIHYGVLVMAAVGIQDLAKRLIKSNLLVRPVTFAVASLFMIVGSVVAYKVLGESKITSGVYKPMESWCSTHVPAKATILAGDIGVIGYYSNAYIYDAVGLVWRDAFKYSSSAAMIDSLKPTYLFLNAARSTAELMKDASVGSHYTPVARFPRGSMNLDTLPDRWVQEYFLFERH